MPRRDTSSLPGAGYTLKCFSVFSSCAFLSHKESSVVVLIRHRGSLLFLFFEPFRLLSVDDILSGRPVGHHGDRITYLLLYEEDVVFAVLRQFIEAFDPADIALPSGQHRQHRLCLLQKPRVREIMDYLSVYLIVGTYRDLVQISESIHHSDQNSH